MGAAIFTRPDIDQTLFGQLSAEACAIAPSGTRHGLRSKLLMICLIASSLIRDYMPNIFFFFFFFFFFFAVHFATNYMHNIKKKIFHLHLIHVKHKRGEQY